MLNKITILLRVGIPVIADQFMVRSKTTAIRGTPSARGIKIAPDPTSRLSGQTSNFALVPSTAGREIQANKSQDSNLTGDPLPKPSTKPSSPRDNTEPQQPNPTLNRTHRSVLRPLPHTG